MKQRIASCEWCRKFCAASILGFMGLALASLCYAGGVKLQTPVTQVVTAGGFRIALDQATQTVLELRPLSDLGFDFSPSDRLSKRTGSGFNQLGDIDFRVRDADDEAWKEYSTATRRGQADPVVDKAAFSSTDLKASLPSECPLTVTRRWMEKQGHLVLEFTLLNHSTKAIEIGALGLPMIFNNIITDRSLEEAHRVCSFSDPYVGREGGYIRVTRLSGHGPALVVVPFGKTSFEAYRRLNEPARPEQTAEGMFEWLACSRAYAENEWKTTQPWNPATSFSLGPASSQKVGVEFLLSPEIRKIDDTLSAASRPVVVGVPGYILPQEQDGKLFVLNTHPIESVSSTPAGAIEIERLPNQHGYEVVRLRAKAWGRASLDIKYKDGTHQSVHYYLTKSEEQAVSDLGHFLTTKQWFTDESDPFRRAPAPISYDREADKQVVQDSRVWIAGLGDEGGSGSFVATAMKEFGQPKAEEVEKFEQFIDKVLWGHIQYSEGPRKYGVRKSLFFYEPSAVPGFAYDKNRNWTSWTSWNKQASEDIGRGYNYPRTVAAYWSMYRLARHNPGLVKSHPWEWYLRQAFETVKYLTSKGANGDYIVGYVDAGLMEGTVFIELLKDLELEGWKTEAELLRQRMEERAKIWIARPYPFGSEMAWDSTGQEEIYGWCKFFGYDDKALVTLNSILGYMPTVPHWGYNGNARRYWDFLYGGKTTRIEKQLHHYGSGLNSIPVLQEYRDHPDDFYLLRVGFAGSMGSISNIDQEGFASVAFHSDPALLKWDAYSGDYGPNFLGHALTDATYVVNHPQLGWIAFGGNVETNGKEISIEPKSAFRKRLYLSSYGLWLTLYGGNISRVIVNTRTNKIRVAFDGATPNCSTADFKVELPGKSKGVIRAGIAPQTRVKLKLGKGSTWFNLN